MEKLFLQLCNCAIVASVAIIAALVFRPVLKKAPSFIRCVLWCLIFLRLMIPIPLGGGMLPTPEIFDFSRILVDEDGGTSIPAATENHGGDGVTDNTVNTQGGESISQGTLAPPSVTVPPVTDGVQAPTLPPATVIPSDKEQQLPNAAPSADEVLESDKEEPVEEENSTVRVLSVIWMTGAVLMLGYMLVSHILLRYRVKDAVVYDSRIRIIPKACTPFVMGLVSPRIYIPSSVSKDDWKYIIAHEDTHIKRLDHIVKPLAFAVLCVYWMNPLLWASYALLCKDIEYACDEKTVGKMEKEEKKAYSMALLSCSAGASIVLAHPLAFGKVSVKDRIKRVMGYKLSLWAICIASLICASIILMVACAHDSSVSDGSQSTSEESEEAEESSQDHSSEESGEESSEGAVSESIDTENRDEPPSTSDLVGGYAGQWTEFSLSPDEYIVWLKGESSKTVRDINYDYVNIHDCAEIEEMREFAKTLNLYTLTLDSNRLQLTGKLYISFYDSSSLLVDYSYIDSNGRPLSCSIRYYDPSYGDALSGGIVNYWNVREANEGRELIDFKDYKIFNQSIYDHTSSSYIDTEVIMKKADPRVRHFMYKTCWVEVFDGDSVFAESELDNIGFDYLWDSSEVNTSKASLYLPAQSYPELKTAEIGFNGTAEGLVSALVSHGALGEGICANYFYVANGVAHIDFNQAYGDYINGGADASYYGTACVVNSLLGYYVKDGARRVLITVNGGVLGDSAKLHALYTAPGKESITSDGTHYAVVSLFDVNAIKQYPCPVTYDGTPQGLIAALAEASGWRQGIEVNSFEIKDRVACIDLNGVFGDQVYAGLMTESGVSCVVETLKYNYGAEIDYVALAIEGEPFKSSYNSYPTDGEEVGFGYDGYFYCAHVDFYELSNIERWLNGTSDKLIAVSDSETASIYSDGYLEKGRELINRYKIYCPRINNNSYMGEKTSYYCFDSYAMITFGFIPVDGKTVGVRYFYLDESYDGYKNGSLSALIDEYNDRAVAANLNTRININDHTEIQVKVHDKQGEVVLEITGLLRVESDGEAATLVFLYNGVIVEMVGEDGFYSSADFATLGFSKLI